MTRVVITGLGFCTCLGHDRSVVVEALRAGKHGIVFEPAFERDDVPIRLIGKVPGYQFPSAEFDDWVLPPDQKLTREQLRSMAPNNLYAHAALTRAIQAAGLEPDLVSHPRTGLLCASGGSMWMAHENLNQIDKRGVMRCPPLSIVSSIPGSLYINLGAIFQIKGSSLGFSSACASSAHALGYAADQIRLGRQDRILVVGAEDGDFYAVVPFAAVRALSTSRDPDRAPAVFDRYRDGFIGTAGGVALVVESLESARARGAKIEAELLGWGEASDGFNVMAPHPEGDGLRRAMELALKDAGLAPEEISYLNAHATGTPFGDLSEVRAIAQVFGEGRGPWVSSTKSLTGHGLSLAGAMEAAFCCLALQERFLPVSAKIRELDPACAVVRILTQPVDERPTVAMSNSSGFGGTNVSLIFRRWMEA